MGRGTDNSSLFSDCRRAPWLLLDIDGVISCFDDYQQQISYENSENRIPVGTIQRLERLQKTFKCVWATACDDKAIDNLVDILGVGSNWPRLQWKQSVLQPGRTWKLADINDFVDNRPCAWIDDELFDDAYDWATQRQAPTLLIAADPLRGLNDTHVTRLEHWATALSL